MIHDRQHTLISVKALPHRKLALRFADGFAAELDFAPLLKHKALSLLADAKLFARARLDARGGYVVWIADDLEMAADNLRHLAVEQSGGIGHERIWNWMHRNGLTQERAAAAIGISRRMLNYYLSSTKPIPLTVWLACIGWEAETRRAAA